MILRNMRVLNQLMLKAQFTVPYSSIANYLYVTPYFSESPENENVVPRNCPLALLGS